MGKWRDRIVAACTLGLVLSSGTSAPAAGASPPCPALAPDARDERPVRLAQAATAVGTAENAVGTLIVKRADGRVEELRGRGALPLYPGDECRTERGSRAVIRLADGTLLAMNEQTRFTIRTREERGGGLARVFKLALGEMWMRVVGAGPIEVETPAATAAIKGTEFNLRVLADGKSILTVLEGTVVFRNEWCSPCSVARAAQSVVERGRPCDQPVAVDPAAVISWITGVVR
jgi:ferric-dicitrate binding protein FerR (iron transport regulator)